MGRAVCFTPHCWFHRMICEVRYWQVLLPKPYVVVRPCKSDTLLQFEAHDGNWPGIGLLDLWAACGHGTMFAFCNAGDYAHPDFALPNSHINVHAVSLYVSIANCQQNELHQFCSRDMARLCLANSQTKGTHVNISQ